MSDRSSKPPLHVPEEELLRRLEEWEAKQPSPPTLRDVMRQDDVFVAAGYVTRSFRIAAREAVQSHGRVQQLRQITLEHFEDEEAAEEFLRAPLLFLHRSPLEGAVESENGLKEAMKALLRYDRCSQ